MLLTHKLFSSGKLKSFRLGKYGLLLREVLVNLCGKKMEIIPDFSQQSMLKFVNSEALDITSFKVSSLSESKLV